MENKMLVSIDIKKGIAEMAKWKPVTWLSFFIAVASAVLVIAYAVYYEISFLRMMLYCFAFLIYYVFCQVY